MTTLNSDSRLDKNMNRQREKTVITIENYRRTVTHSRLSTLNAHCGHCNVETQMISPGEAAALLQTTARELFRRIEAGDIHFSETENGGLLVCRNSCQAAR
jgi:hypothetical protein